MEKYPQQVETHSSTGVFWDRNRKKSRLTPPLEFLQIMQMLIPHLKGPSISSIKKIPFVSPGGILQVRKGISGTTAKHCPSGTEQTELFPFRLRLALPLSSCDAETSAALPDSPHTFAVQIWWVLKKDSDQIWQNPQEILRLAPKRAIRQLGECRIE